MIFIWVKISVALVSAESRYMLKEDDVNIICFYSMLMSLLRFSGLFAVQ